MPASVYMVLVQNKLCRVSEIKEYVEFVTLKFWLNDLVPFESVAYTFLWLIVFPQQIVIRGGDHPGSSVLIDM